MAAESERSWPLCPLPLRSWEHSGFLTKALQGGLRSQGGSGLKPPRSLRRHGAEGRPQLVPRLGLQGGEGALEVRGPYRGYPVALAVHSPSGP